MRGHEKPLYGVHVTEDRLLTVNAAASLLSVSRQSIYRLIRSKELQPVKVGKRLRFRVSEINRYLDRSG